MRTKAFLLCVLFVSIISFLVVGESMAWSARSIDADVDTSLNKFEDIQGAKSVIAKAEGILVFPHVFKAGFGIGGEYGEGALRIDGKTVDYYNTAAASIGFQLGGQKKTIIIAFMDKGALEDFRNSSGWKIGADASVAVIAIGSGAAIDSSNINEPIVGFILDQKGLMYNLTLEGAKITKLNKS